MFKLIIKIFVIQIFFLLLISCYSDTTHNTKNKPIQLNPIPPADNIYKTKPGLKIQIV